MQKKVSLIQAALSKTLLRLFTGNGIASVISSVAMTMALVMSCWHTFASTRILSHRSDCDQETRPTEGPKATFSCTSHDANTMKWSEFPTSSCRTLADKRVELRDKTRSITVPLVWVGHKGLWARSPAVKSNCSMYLSATVWRQCKHLHPVSCCARYVKWTLASPAMIIGTNGYLASRIWNSLITWAHVSASPPGAGYIPPIITFGLPDTSEASCTATQSITSEPISSKTATWETSSVATSMPTDLQLVVWAPNHAYAIPGGRLAPGGQRAPGKTQIWTSCSRSTQEIWPNRHQSISSVDKAMSPVRPGLKTASLSWVHSRPLSAEELSSSAASIPPRYGEITGITTLRFRRVCFSISLSVPFMSETKSAKGQSLGITPPPIFAMFAGFVGARSYRPWKSFSAAQSSNRLGGSFSQSKAYDSKSPKGRPL